MNQDPGDPEEFRFLQEYQSRRIRALQSTKIRATLRRLSGMRVKPPTTQPDPPIRIRRLLAAHG